MTDIKKVTIKLKDYGELVEKDYSFGDATITITLEEYVELAQKRNEKFQEERLDKEINNFYKDVEGYINKGYSAEKSREKYENVITKFKKFPGKTKNKLYHTLSESLEEAKDLKYMGQVANVNIILEGLKNNI